MACVFSRNARPCVSAWGRLGVANAQSHLIGRWGVTVWLANARLSMRVPCEMSKPLACLRGPCEQSTALSRGHNRYNSPIREKNGNSKALIAICPWKINQSFSVSSGDTRLMLDNRKGKTILIWIPDAQGLVGRHHSCSTQIRLLGRNPSVQPQKDALFNSYLWPKLSGNFHSKWNYLYPTAN